MSSNAQSILQVALALSESERFAIASRLLESLPPDDDALEIDDPELLEELNRRANDGDQGVPWADVKARLTERYGEHA